MKKDIKKPTCIIQNSYSNKSTMTDIDSTKIIKPMKAANIVKK